MSRKPILSAVVCIGVAYLAYPYVALYRLDTAVRGGDSARLAAMIDWDQVREGLTEDICDQIDAAPAKPATAQAAAYPLPAFGASFIKGIAATAIETEITPETLGRIVSHRTAVPEGQAGSPRAMAFDRARVKWAFFESPSTFSVLVRTADAVPSEGPIKLRMELIEGAWKITRIWLPPALLKRARAQG